MQADRLLGPEMIDVDGNIEDRSDTISVFNGPSPEIVIAKSEEEEIESVSEWIVSRNSNGILPHEFGIIVRSDDQLDRAIKAIEKTGIPYKILDENVEITADYL